MNVQITLFMPSREFIDDLKTTQAIGKLFTEFN